MSAHGATPGIRVDVWLGDDPELALVDADLSAYADAHPCTCEGLCQCDPEPDRGVCMNCGRSPEGHEDDITGNAPWCLDCMDAES